MIESGCIADDEVPTYETVKEGGTVIQKALAESVRKQNTPPLSRADYPAVAVKEERAVRKKVQLLGSKHRKDDTETKIISSPVC